MLDTCVVICAYKLMFLSMSLWFHGRAGEYRKEFAIQYGLIFFIINSLK